MTQNEWRKESDEQTAGAVQAAFADVYMTRSVPVTTSHDTVAQPTRSARTTRRWVAATVGAAAAAVAITVGGVVVGGSGSTAWAAVPSAPTAADVSLAVEQCSVPFTSAGDRGSAAASPVAVAPSTLQVLDIRGAGAVAIFTEGEASLVCTLAQVDGAWQFAGSTASDEPPGSARGVLAGMATELPDGTGFASLHGYADAGTESVSVTLASGLQAEASISSVGDVRQFAVWFPVSADELAGATVTAVDAQGMTSTLPALTTR